MANAKSVKRAKTIDNRKQAIEALVIAALDVLDCQNLTANQRMYAEQAYEFANQLEYSIT